MRVHDAAHAAIDSTGGSVSQMLRSQVLRDPTLASRGNAGVNPPPGNPVGSASVYQNGNIPSTVAAAISNFQTNQNNNSLASILQQVLHGVGGSYAPSPQQNALFQAQTEQTNAANATAARPGLLQQQIDARTQPQSSGVLSIAPSLPGQYNPAKDDALQSLYGQQAAAKQAQINGWTSMPGTYSDPAVRAYQQQSALYNAGRITY
jgi:hypothetical protein